MVGLKVGQAQRAQRSEMENRIIPFPTDSTGPASLGGLAQSPEEVTQLLQQWRHGDKEAADRLIPLVYRQLKALAASAMRCESHHHTMQPTALLHEAFLRLAQQNQVTWSNRRQFFAVAARSMRQVLVDHARERLAQKRGVGVVKVSLSCPDCAPEILDERTLCHGHDALQCDVVAVDSALEQLADMDPELARIVELRFFAGFTIEETAQALSLSPASVKRGWATARAWLYDRLRSP